MDISEETKKKTKKGLLDMVVVCPALVVASYLMDLTHSIVVYCLSLGITATVLALAFTYIETKGQERPTLKVAARTIFYIPLFSIAFFVALIAAYYLFLGAFEAIVSHPWVILGISMLGYIVVRLLRFCVHLLYLKKRPYSAVLVDRKIQ
jgi:hypothetical protein